MEPPIGFVRAPSLAEQIRTMVRSEQLAQAATALGAETFADADDFDVNDDYDPSSPYEEQFDPLPISELERRRDLYNAELAKRKTPSTEQTNPQPAAGGVAPNAPPDDGVPPSSAST